MKQYRANAERKLKEIYRWLALLGQVCIVYSEDYYLQLPKMEERYYRAVPLYPENNWRNRAPEEIVGIIEAINSIKDTRLRMILILRYIERDSKKKDSIRNLVGVKNSRYYVLVGVALLEFADCYRNGLLKKIDL